MEKTLVIIKPGAIQRGLIGEVVRRFEQKGLQICGMKMIQLLTRANRSGRILRRSASRPPASSPPDSR